MRLTDCCSRLYLHFLASLRCLATSTVIVQTSNLVLGICHCHLHCLIYVLIHMQPPIYVFLHKWRNLSTLGRQRWPWPRNFKKRFKYHLLKTSLVQQDIFDVKHFWGGLYCLRWQYVLHFNLLNTWTVKLQSTTIHVGACNVPPAAELALAFQRGNVWDIPAYFYVLNNQQKWVWKSTWKYMCRIKQQLHANFKFGHFALFMRLLQRK